MNFRVALILLVLGFLSLLIVMGALTFISWLKTAYPRRFRSILVALCLAIVGLGIWGYMEASLDPAFHTGDLLTLQEPVVARLAAVGRGERNTACIIDIYEHLAVVAVRSGTMSARVESNNTSGPSFCPVGVEVQVERAWLHLYTLTHRHS